MSTAMYEVEGLTCGACIGEVLGQVLALADVREASMDRTTGAYALTVVGTPAPDIEGVRGALRAGGFSVTVRELEV